MKGCLLLPLLLLGTVSAVYLEKDAPHLGDLETQADLSQDPEGSGGQEGELAVSGEVLESGREEAEDTHDDEGASDPDDLDEDVQCPKEEETVQLPGSPEGKIRHYLMLQTPRTFANAQRVCRQCYRGNLASIHNFNVNRLIHHLSIITNYGQVWIGGFIRVQFRCRRFFWIDGSYWNFAYWAAGQPTFGTGHCVALNTRGGRWRRAPCNWPLPFVCSF
ncbi:proteoglycan 3-like isoform X1 [Bos taurus]|uniref:MGC140461 protein n=1 Tax=Bos taurus TaxID=9913 RepID=A4IF76_BOVIN|nr:proteoglycan 3-like precursor [Bos taurus]XP_024831327.1 proteoglycan 3-like isoform X1 [Bos taurus]XP_024831328.1 proteoglycan 3-like isoform X1 [Bos taurus]AAI34439.1 MGC140461 protein [Bos taurus]